MVSMGELMQQTIQVLLNIFLYAMVEQRLVKGMKLMDLHLEELDLGPKLIMLKWLQTWMMVSNFLVEQ